MVQVAGGRLRSATSLYYSVTSYNNYIFNMQSHLISMVFFWAIWKKSTSVCWLGLLATEYFPGHLEVNVVTTLIMLDLRLAISQIMFHCSKWPSYVNTFWHEDFKEVYFFVRQLV